VCFQCDIVCGFLFFLPISVWKFYEVFFTGILGASDNSLELTTGPLFLLIIQVTFTDVVSQLGKK